jgi:lipase chaperone LimK
MTDHPDCAGNKAIKLLLSEIQDEVPELIKFGRVRRMPRAPVILVLMVFPCRAAALFAGAPAHSPVTMDTLKADREKRETPEEAKRPWDGLYLTGPHALERRQPSRENEAPAFK